MNQQPRKQQRPMLSWAEKQERHAAKMAKKTPEQVESYAMNLAMWHLSKRQMTERDLRTKLTGKLVPEDVSERTLDRLKALGAVDDIAYAESFARSAFRNRSMSAGRVRRELSRKGVSEDDIEEALTLLTGGASVDAEWDRALTVAGKKARSTRKETDPQKRRRKITSAVMSKGFTYDMAARSVEEVLSQELTNE